METHSLTVHAHINGQRGEVIELIGDQVDGKPSVGVRLDSGKLVIFEEDNLNHWSGAKVLPSEQSTKAADAPSQLDSKSVWAQWQRNLTGAGNGQAPALRVPQLRGGNFKPPQ